MKISRHFPIKGCIIKEEDIRRIIGIMGSEFSILSTKSKHVRLKFKGHTEDGIVFESDNMDDFIATELMQTKRTLSFDSSLSDFNNDLSIHVSLSHGDSKYGNSVSVQGTDANWVTAVLTRLKESIEASAPQNPAILKHKTLIQFLCAFGIGRIYSLMLDVLFLPFEGFLRSQQFSVAPPAWLIPMISFLRTYPVSFVILNYLIWFPAGWFASYFLISKAEDLWPSVEFQIGPPHTHIEKRRRSLIYKIFVIGIAPLLVSIVYDILKSFS